MAFETDHARHLAKARIGGFQAWHLFRLRTFILITLPFHGLYPVDLDLLLEVFESELDIALFTTLSYL